jgi:hypothetical protein
MFGCQVLTGYSRRFVSRTICTSTLRLSRDGRAHGRRVLTSQGKTPSIKIRPLRRYLAPAPLDGAVAPRKRARYARASARRLIGSERCNCWDTKRPPPHQKKLNGIQATCRSTLQGGFRGSRRSVSSAVAPMQYPRSER